MKSQTLIKGCCLAFALFMLSVGLIPDTHALTVKKGEAGESIKVCSGGYCTNTVYGREYGLAKIKECEDCKPGGDGCGNVYKDSKGILRDKRTGEVVSERTYTPPPPPPCPANPANSSWLSGHGTEPNCSWECNSGFKQRGGACYKICNSLPQMASWTGDGYTPQCNQYACNANHIAVGNDGGDMNTGVHTNICKRGSRCIAPQTIAPNSEAKLSCAGLQSFSTTGGSLVHAFQYRMVVKKAGVVVFDTGSTYKPLGTTSGELSGYNVGDQWVDFSEYSDGDYSLECFVQYDNAPYDYTSTCGFRVDPAGTSCDSLSFDPDSVGVGGTTNATCNVSNSQGGKRNIVTVYEQGPYWWTTIFFTTNILSNYPSPSQIASQYGMSSFSQNGTYRSFCSAVANVSYDGFALDNFVPTYQLVTSAACRENIYVGESYCESILKPSQIYVNTDFSVTCRLDTTASTTPTAYDIVSIDAAGNTTVIKTGAIPAGATQITDTIQRGPGTHTIGCLIRGPENTSYVAPNCKTEIIPQDIPVGSCTGGDIVTNAVLCPGDGAGIGADVPQTIVETCTASRKCEYTCDANSTRSGNKCVPKALCVNLATPSHIRPGRDYPMIECQGDSNTRYFRYKISGPDINYTSAAYPTNASGFGEKIHESFLPKSGTYVVTCAVGNDANSINIEGAITPACKKNIISDPNAPFCKRLDRYEGGSIDKRTSVPVGTTIQYTCVAQPGSPSLGSANDLFKIRYQTPSGPQENVGGPAFNLPPLGFPIFQGQQLSLAYGNHTTNCLVKIGSGYSTAPECEDKLCSSDTGNCSEPVCEPGDNVCCANELNPYGVCCRLDPLHQTCDNPITYPPTDMMRRICTNASTTNVLIGCYDDSCVDYGIDDSSTLTFTTVTNPYLQHGALIFATVLLNFVDKPVPLYIQDGNGIISTRYLYWEGSDMEDPTSGGFRYYTYPASSEILAPRWINSDVKVAIDCKDGVGRSIDTLFCGCDIPDDHNFQIEYGSKPITRDSGNINIQNEDALVFNRIISQNEKGELAIRDTSGRNASGSPYTYDIDWIDKQVPQISISTGAGPIGSIDRAVTTSTDVTVTLTDSISGIISHDIKIANANALIDVVNPNCSGGSASYPTKGQASVSLPLGVITTDKAIFVCVKDSAGNITTKKFTFGGTRVINYFQGPVMGFSYSGELGVSDPDSYEKKLIDRVQSGRVAVNDTYNARDGDRISCQNTAIEQNIDVLARGRLVPKNSNLVLSTLTGSDDNNLLVGSNQKNTDGIIYYSFDATGGAIDGNSGKVVEISGDAAYYPNWNAPQAGPTSPETETKAFRKVSIGGLKTLIIEGGNLYINADMYYEDPQSMLVIIVKRGTPSIHGHGQGGNVYIDKDVTNVNGLIFADGALLNVEKDGSGGLSVLSSYEEEDVEKLRRQLLIYGSLASANTRGGSLKVDGSGTKIAYKISEYDGTDGYCPYGTDLYRSNGSTGPKNCVIQDAAKYDLETFRTFNLGFSDLPYRLNQSATYPLCNGVQCVCATGLGGAHERTPVGGIGTTTIIPDYFNSTTYALSGKRKCFYSQPKGDPKFEVINDYYATYVKFDTRDLKFKFPILSEGTCR